MKNLRFAFGILIAFALACCNGGTMTEKAALPQTLDSVSPAEWEKLLNARLFFGHQSVGFNIIEGMNEVLSRKGGPSLTVKETRDPAAAVGPGLFHATIGQNGDPLGKIRGFDAIMRDGMAKQVDVAFMKLCYVDVGPGTDVAAIFASYKETLSHLKTDYPTTMFVHFTVPLVSQEKGIKPLVKGILGRHVRGFEDNLVRDKLNSLLRTQYAGKEPLFDLALFESTRPDGSRTLSELAGRKYAALEAMYTDDGGHLNETGRGFIAQQLLVLLAGVSR